MVEAKQRTNRGNMSSSFGLFNEQCGVPVDSSGRDTEGVYMGAPVGTEPMMGGGMGKACPECGQSPCMCGGSMPTGGGLEIELDGTQGIDDDDMVMDDQMMMMFMNEETTGGGACDRDPHYVGNQTDCEGDCPNCGPCGVCNDGGKVTDYETMDHKDRSKFDGRDSEVVGVYDDMKKLRQMKENYKAVNYSPARDSWGNKYNHILNESSKVNGAKSLMHRMKRVIR